MPVKIKIRPTFTVNNTTQLKRNFKTTVAAHFSFPG